MVLLYSNVTAGSALHPANSGGAQTLHAYENNANNYDKLVVIGVVKIKSAAGSTGQAITLDCVVGESTESLAYTVKAAADEDYVVLVNAAPARDAASVVKTDLAQAGAADGNTDVTSMSIFVFGENDH